MGQFKRQRDNWGTAMEVEYVQTVEDHLAFNNYHYATLPWWRRYGAWTITWPLLIVLQTVGVLVIPSTPGAAPQQGASLTVWTLVGLAVFEGFLITFFVGNPRKFLARRVRRFVAAPQNKKRFTGWRKCSIAPDGVRLRQEEGSMTLKWTAVLRIAQNDDYVFLYTTSRNALIVPRRPFASDEQFQQFVATAQCYRDTAQKAGLEARASGRQSSEADTNIKQDERADH